ncbi:MAG: hypothetical protein AVDCRST_MAG69-667, partial [uncultured Solirubrobacteraceae bacterium]
LQRERGAPGAGGSPRHGPAALHAGPPRRVPRGRRPALPLL